ncbi:serine/threonine protein kinase [Nostocaceae cyanobacterium CENA357]|uniref:Serine/threonine protein kinase n=1 Tax=Atlanticothrix silvestris CENA357 TaxID=1725252 RepID=A0A8J7L5M6_9CYAN|nr:4-Cys prefix domain-containing protein [Atlanticothrix silvestris]MBH8553237.1 serine/threonine protein kinase [Atlanticothrix silvestris CENA357]
MSLCINPACPQPYYPDNHKDRFCKSCGSQMELLSRYRVIRLLSEKTGFGKVYEIYEQNIPKILKVLHEDLSNNAKAVELFQQEASVLKQMQHPGIPKIDSYFQYQTRNGLVLHCIAMEKVDGFDSEQWLQKQHNHFTAQKSEQQQSRIKAARVSQTKQIPQVKFHTSLPPLAKQSKKVPLQALFAAMLVSLAFLNAIALVTGYPKFVALPNHGQFPQRKGKIDYFPYEEGRDSQGRIAKFNIAVLSVEYKWLLGSNFQIKYNDQVISLEVLKLNLEQEGIQKIMKNPSEIISVGTASCEGNVEVEQRRALERSKQIQILAKKLFNNTPSVKGYRLLNLGRFQRSNCQTNRETTAYQRSVILIGVKKQSANVILDEALRDRLEKKPFADFKLEDYSLGSVDKFRTIISNL